MQVLLPVALASYPRRPCLFERGLCPRKLGALSAKRETGLGLVEVIVALLLLAIALLGLAVGFPVSRAAVYLGDRMTTAVSLAQQTLEAMRNRQYAATIDEIRTEDFPGEDPVPDFPAFRRVVTIQDNVPIATCVPPGPPCSKTVTVAVFFRDHAGQEQSVQLATIFVR